MLAFDDEDAQTAAKVDDGTDRLAGLLGRPAATGLGRVCLAELDAALRSSAPNATLLVAKQVADARKLRGRWPAASAGLVLVLPAILRRPASVR